MENDNIVSLKNFKLKADVSKKDMQESKNNHELNIVGEEGNVIYFACKPCDSLRLEVTVAFVCENIDPVLSMVNGTQTTGLSPITILNIRWRWWDRLIYKSFSSKVLYKAKKARKKLIKEIEVVKTNIPIEIEVCKKIGGLHIQKVKKI